MMMDRLGKLGMVLLATILIWGATFGVWTMLGDTAITQLAALTSFGATVALWLVLGLSTIDQKPPPTADAAEKAKRGAAEDARLALLLQLMDDDERRAIKRRLVDDLGGDGELIPLADLLADEQRARRRA